MLTVKIAVRLQGVKIRRRLRFMPVTKRKSTDMDAQRQQLVKLIPTGKMKTGQAEMTIC